ncbi:MAG: sulfotransferase family 2 domain-containing protein [Pseudomonadota bacterium]
MRAHEFAIALDAYGAVYIDIAKVASSSIKAVLADALGLPPQTNPHAIEFPRPDAEQRGTERAYPQRFCFTFVRNPWDRLVSCYRDKICGEVQEFTQFAPSGVAHCLAGYSEFWAGMSFADFVIAVAKIPDARADEHFCSQAAYVLNDRGEVALDFVGRYESLAADFAHVAAVIGLPATLRLPHLQAAPARDYRAYYTEETWTLVAQRYRADVESFGYGA